MCYQATLGEKLGGARRAPGRVVGGVELTKVAHARGCAECRDAVAVDVENKLHWRAKLAVKHAEQRDGFGVAAKRGDRDRRRAIGVSGTGVGDSMSCRASRSSRYTLVSVGPAIVRSSASPSSLPHVRFDLARHASWRH
jgi:hypothetical protein